MRKKIKKAIPVRYHDGLSQLRPNAGGIDIGASEVWVDVGNKDAEPTRMFETFTADLNRWEIGLRVVGSRRDRIGAAYHELSAAFRACNKANPVFGQYAQRADGTLLDDSFAHH